MLTTGLYDSIMIQAQDAIRFLPAEDKLNLALAVTTAPKADDDTCIMQTVVELKDALTTANDTIAALQAKVHANGTNVNP